jgi:hypothetical protein
MVVRNMPLDASDKIRKIQETVLFTGYVNKTPRVNVSSCTTFYNSSNTRAFNTYEYKTQIEEGRIYFSTCRG